MDDFPLHTNSNTGEGGMMFDSADCEDFLARLEAEFSAPSSYTSSHSFSPGELLSSGNGSSPLSSLSPQTDDNGDIGNFNYDAGSLFMFDPSNPQQQFMQPMAQPQLLQSQHYIKSEYGNSIEPSKFLNEPDTPPYGSMDYGKVMGSNNSMNSNCSASVSPISTSSTQNFVAPGSISPNTDDAMNMRNGFIPSPPMENSVSPDQKVAKGGLSDSVFHKRATTAKDSISRSSFSHGTSSTENSPEQNAQGVKGGRITKPKKTAHNMIEKRYRTNLNDKIAALRDCVPSLRRAVKGSYADNEADDLEGLEPASKLNKATVLTKATEYIFHLQQRNLQLQRENKALLERQQAAGLGPLNTHIGSMGSIPGDQSMMDNLVPGTVNSGTNRRLGTSGIGTNGSNLMGKIVMGSMAGLMVANSFDNVDGNTRGLSALPFMVRNYAWRAFGSNSPAIFASLKLFLFLGALLFIFYPSFFDNQKPQKSKGSTGKQMVRQSATLPSLSLSMPLEVRQQAWLTAMQTVDVPPRSTLLEAFAITRKLSKLIVRRVFGYELYKMLTQTTDEEDLARISAWQTAIDAQLGGGDSECSRVRLLITLLASMIAPSTPVRVMMQTLHVKILLHDMPLFQGLSRRLQQKLWEDARELQREQDASTTTSQEERSPEHIVGLLECDDSEVFDNDMVTRAYNMTWNRPLGQGCVSSLYRDESMDFTVEDPAIKSPLDVLAAWYVCRKLRQALIQSLDGEPDVKLLSAAVKIAPPNSVVGRRTIIARSMLVGAIHPEYSKEMMETLRDDLNVSNQRKQNQKTHEDEGTTSSDDNVTVVDSDREDVEDEELESVDDVVSTTSSTALLTDSVNDLIIAPFNSIKMLSLMDIRVAVRCALVQTVLPSRPYIAEKLYNGVEVYEASDLGLLGFVSLLRTVRKMERRRPVEKISESLVGKVRIWIGGDEGEAAGIATETRRAIVQECVRMGMRLGGYDDLIVEEDDEGYATGE
ncbi:hypothetical protein V1511DRAFT_500053 [Dipodascopsis uninucleata]